MPTEVTPTETVTIDLPENGLLQPMEESPLAQVERIIDAHVAALTGTRTDADVMEDDGPADTNPNTVIHEGFVIDSDAKLEWLLRKIANLEAEKRRIEARAADMVKGLQSQIRALQRRFESDVDAYVRQRLADTKARGKTYKTLQGNVTIKREPAAIKVTDAGAVMDALRDRGILDQFEQVTLDTAHVRKWLLEQRAEALAQAEASEGDVPDDVLEILEFPGTEYKEPGEKLVYGFGSEAAVIEEILESGQ